MVDFIIGEFAYLTENNGYSLSVYDVNNIVKNIVYSKENIDIIFTCELMETQFDFEIRFRLNGTEYSVCENAGRMKIHYENIGSANVIHKSVFEYTEGIFDETSFQHKKEVLYHKKYGFDRYQKLFCETVLLYKELLIPAIENIENIGNFSTQRTRMKLKINVKQVGRKKPEIGKYEMEVASQSYDLRGLITEIVTLSVDDYNRRVSDKSIKKLLSDDEMADMSEVGKIAFGINYGENKAVPGHAVETAVSGFRDGFFRVFLDDREIMSLDEAVEITHDSVLTFIRLVMLSGRLW